jgi:hypothetical protein
MANRTGMVNLNGLLHAGKVYASLGVDFDAISR